MIRNEKREEEIAAFRRFARLGLHRLTGEMAVIARLRGACRDGEALDLLAVADTLRLLEATGKSAAARAVREVYLRGVRGRLHAREVSMDVTRAAFLLHCDERTVYRYLAAARGLWRRLRDYYRARGAAAILGRAEDEKDEKKGPDHRSDPAPPGTGDQSKDRSRSSI